VQAIKEHPTRVKIIGSVAHKHAAYRSFSFTLKVDDSAILFLLKKLVFLKKNKDMLNQNHLSRQL
jgi:hypothetical protein